MGLIDEAKGTLKEGKGKVSGDRSEEFEGTGQQIGGDLEDAADKAADAARDALDRSDDRARRP